MKQLLFFTGNVSIKIGAELFESLFKDILLDQYDFLFVSTEKSFLKRLNMPENTKFYLPSIQNRNCLNLKNSIDFSKSEISLILKAQKYEKILFLCDGFTFSYLLLLNSLFELTLYRNIHLKIFCLDSFSHQHFLDKNLEKKIAYIIPKKFVQFLPTAKNYKKNFEKHVKNIILKAISQEK